MTGRVLTAEWLFETNKNLAAEGVPAEKRLQEARAIWYSELLPDRLACGDSEAEYNLLQAAQQRSFANIESFFLTQNEKRLATGLIGGPIYRGAFYYLGEFWPFFVPLIMGQIKLRFLKYLEVPPEISAVLMHDEFGLREFSFFAQDCVDYGYAIDEVMSKDFPDTANRFFVSADAHLSATSQMLFMGPRDTKPILDAAMSIEIFCKAFLAAKDGKSETQLRLKYSHDVKKLVSACSNSGLTELSQVAAIVDSLPHVDGRYQTTECVFGELWQAYRAALFVGVTVLRHLTGRDCRKPIVSG